MGKIQILNDQIANQIAAGEVVERPASVIKELIENSIDAGSTRIDISIEEGGLQLIRVTDNGNGIELDDCEVAFQRHATSKIKESRDLFNIRSLGFRGEALPSIAAVARLECNSSTRSDGLGYHLVIEGGKITQSKQSASNQGTDIQVKDLFFNTPARLKYMETLQTELGHISDYMYRMALACPTIAFTFKHQGKVLLQTLGNGDIQQVIAAIYGVNTAKKMIPVKGETMDYRVKGFVSLPEWTRANRYAMTMIVNGRYIRNFMLSKAIMDAYHTLLPIHRYPLAVLHIEMDSHLIDVNVHPSKLEVRFSKEKELYDTVKQAVFQALQDQTLIPKGQEQKKSGHAQVHEQLQWKPTQQSPNPVPENTVPKSSIPKEASSGQNFAHQYHQDSQPEHGSRTNTPNSRHQKPNLRTSSAEKPNADQVKELYRNYESEDFSEEELASSNKPLFPMLYPVGQMKGTYILAQNEDAFYIIDQHAAHERIHYELFYNQFGTPASVSQELIIPITLEMTPSETDLLSKRLPMLEQVGVYLQSFGGNTFKVSAYPHWLPSGDEKSIIDEMVDWVIDEKQIDLKKIREKASILCSCKASIKANQSLSMVEMESLLQRLGNCQQPYTCPHGRPIIISFSNYELEKMFKRVM